MPKRICIYSCGIAPELPQNLEEYLRQAEYVYGSKKILDKLPVHNAAAVCINAKAKKQAREILTLAAQGRKILVLCSGDSLFHGFGSTLLSLADTEEFKNTADCIEIIPNITAFQSLCAKCRIPWQNAELFTAHSQNTLPIRQIANSQTAIVYGGTKYTAADIAQEISLFSPEQKKRRAVFAENLGTEKEKIIQAALEEIRWLTSSPTSILLLLPYENPLPQTPEENLADQQEHCLTLGLDDEIYLKENNLITHADSRAVILSRLRLLPQGVFWDLGAGSGSVGLEAAGLSKMHVYAVEKNEQRFMHMQKNQYRLGIDRYTPLLGEITELIPTLPQADRVFIGGGGQNICRILDMCKKYSKKNARILVSAVTLETCHQLYGYQNMLRLDIVHIGISTEKALAQKYHCLAPKKPLYLFIYQNT